MIHLFVRFGKWLETRFPEKMVVTASDYQAVSNNIATAHIELSLLRNELRELQANHAATLDRLGRVESAAVHKGAVQDLMTVTQTVKDELVALKVNLGWSKPTVEGAQSSDVLQAMLNGEAISG